MKYKQHWDYFSIYLLLHETFYNNLDDDDDDDNDDNDNNDDNDDDDDNDDNDDDNDDDKWRQFLKALKNFLPKLVPTLKSFFNISEIEI